MGQEKICAERGLGNLFSLICIREIGGRLAIVGKLLLEFLAGEENAALDGAEGEIHMLGDFVVFVAGDVHRERHLIGVFKRIYYRRDFF